MSFKKRVTALALAAAMTFGTLSFAIADSAVKDDLAAQMAGDIKHVISAGLGIDTEVYSNLEVAGWTEAHPARFDLRDRGIVPPVRDQGPLGTCWSFASIGASEISILNSLGMTAEEFEALTGVEMDLSEKHLSWFTSVPLPEGEDEDQAGEGHYMFDPEAPSVDNYLIDGFMGYASGLFASGAGPVHEILAPYADSEGEMNMAGDWSLDEGLRFASTFELKDSSILPCPAGTDADGNYEYNPVATEMIKGELLKGRAVTIAYASDQAMDPDSILKLRVDQTVAQGYDPRISELMWKQQMGYPDPDDITDEESREVLRLTIALADEIPLEEVTDEIVDEISAMIEARRAEKAAALAAMTEEEIATQEAENEEIMAQARAEARAKVDWVAQRFDADPAYLAAFVNDLNGVSAEEYFVNWDTYAQYVSNPEKFANHAVTIVGYDDDYPVSNFRADNPPPAPGAWIVRNSWGGDWGNDGYFCLSYYDKTICAPESFEYVTDADAMTASQLYIHQYDFMPAIGIHSALTKEPVYLANEFTVNADSVLSYVSAMTANYNTNVTVAVYLLNDDAASPVDGKLLDVRTVNYDYAGYHRIALNQHYLLPEGTRISVVQTQRINLNDGRYYAVPYTYACNGAFYEVYNELPIADEQSKAKSAVNGVINRGESFISADGEWSDWADFVETVKNSNTYVNEFASFDNVSIKAYFYLLSDITEEHAFGGSIPYAGGTVKLCTDCGYALVEQ